jgi:hypothetical protein
MTGLALLLEDRRDVFGKGWRAVSRPAEADRARPSAPIATATATPIRAKDRVPTIDGSFP